MRAMKTGRMTDAELRLAVEEARASIKAIAVSHARCEDAFAELEDELTARGFQNVGYMDDERIIEVAAKEAHADG